MNLFDYKIRLQWDWPVLYWFCWGYCRAKGFCRWLELGPLVVTLYEK